MENRIFINLAVKDLDRSMAFYRGLGWQFNPRFTDATAACLVISDHIYAMLLTPGKFSGFLPEGKTPADAHRSTEVLLALSFPSREKLNEMVDSALAAGATVARPPEDLGFMFTRSFNDPDGHIWEMFWMDAAAVNTPQST